jgi:hypothetical protein
MLGLISSLPLRQPLEGSLQTTGLSFETPARSERAESQTFLPKVALESLTISGLQGEKPLQLAIDGQKITLDAANSLTIRAKPGKKLRLAMLLPPGSLVRSISMEPNKTLVIDLLSSGDAKGQEEPVLVITPPRWIEGVLEGGETAKTIRVPTFEFPLPLTGAMRVSLPLGDQSTATLIKPSLLVKNVSFEEQEYIEKDLINRSTIQSGMIFLGRHEPLNIRKKQFLLVDSPGIKILSDLVIQAHPRPPFAIGVVGETARLRTGLSRSQPTTVLQGSLISRYFSPNQVSSVYGFLTGLASSALGLLFKAD